jgi:hypothetical protein
VRADLLATALGFDGAAFLEGSRGRFAPSPAGATAAVLRFSIGRADTDRYIASFSDPQGDVAILFVLPPSVILELRNGRTDLPPQ